MTDTETTRRVRVLARFALGWAFLIFLKLVYLQIFQHKEFVRAAESQQRMQMEIQGPRGTIFDRTGLPLAKSLPVDSVCLNPLRVPDMATAAQLLAPVLSLDPVEVYSNIKDAAEKKRGFLWIKRRITPAESTRLRSMNLEWIEFRTESRRFYPNGQLSSHAIGSVDHREHGNGGLELGLDDDLAGKAGEVKMLADSRHNVYAEEVESEPLPGKDVYTTLDSRIQYIAERSLAQAVISSHAKSGSVVAMDPRTGDVLVMANYPTFDPNIPPQPGESAASRNNLAVTSPYEPGSVFKVVTMATGLDAHKITPQTVVNCGAIRIGNHTYKESHAGYFGSLTTADVLAHSSNLGAMQVGFRIGPEVFQEHVRRFGFGKPTGIGLPSESGGRVRKKWSTMTLASVSMGHEVMVTALQLAQMGAVVANGGTLVRPRLWTKKQRAGEAPEMAPAVQGTRVLRPESAIELRKMMEGVVLFGTGRGHANLKEYTSGGKTGTAMIFNTATNQYTHFYNGSYLGFAPMTNPAIVIVVTVNGTSGLGGYGGTVAAPVFRDVATEALRILDIPKDLPEEFVAVKEEKGNSEDLAIAGLDPEAVKELMAGDDAAVDAPQSGPRVPNFKGKTMRGVLEEAASSGTPVEVMGSGIARLQMPPPGAFLPPGEKVRIQFAR